MRRILSHRGFDQATGEMTAFAVEMIGPDDPVPIARRR